MSKPPLTKSKAKTVKQRKLPVAKGTTLNYNAAVQSRYKAKLEALVNYMAIETKKEVERFMRSKSAKTFFAMDANVGSDARIMTDELTKRFQQLFDKRSKGLAEDMLNQSDKASTASLHTSLKQLSGGLSLKTSSISGPLKEVMTAAVAENVGLIRSIPAQYMQRVQGQVMRSITTGQGLQDLIPQLDRYAGITKRRATNIALDQTRKAYNSLNQGKMQRLGVQKYEWIHAGGGQHPRELHVALSGLIYSFDDPPIIQYATDSQPEVRGKPGDLPNCGCKIRPIVTFDNGKPEDQTEN